MTGQRTRGEAARPLVVKSFVRRFRSDILAEWRRSARELPLAKELTSVSLVDHIPEMLDEIAEIAEQLGADRTPSSQLATARDHAVDRLGAGFDVVTLVRELSLLRAAALSVWARSQPDGTMAELRALDLAIDHAIAVSVGRYTEEHERSIAGNRQLEHELERTAGERERALAKLDALLSAAPVGIAFVDQELRYLRINDALAALHGRPAEEHIGRTVEEMLPEALPRLVSLLRGVLETGVPVLNLELARGDRSFLASYFPIRSTAGETLGVGGIVFDVSEQKRAEEALRVEQTRIQSILEHSPAAIWLKDHEGRIVLANHQLAEALGHELHHLIGRTSGELLPPEIAREHEAHDAIVLREQRSLEVEEVVPSPRGLRTFLSIKFPIPGERPLIGAIATEISQRKAIEEELRIAVRTREDVLSVVSHDLRGPLGTVQLSATMLLHQHGADSRSRRHLDVIQRSCTRMENLIDDLLDTTSIRTGRLQLEVRRELVESIVTEALDLHEPIADEKSIRLAHRCELHGIEVLCDRDRVLQVFGNLIGNAVKFCRAGDTITVQGERTGDDVVFSVADTGPGIAPDVLAYLFEPYWSGSEHTKRGSGLGLYISRGIVEGHGGRIWVESTPGSGAKFLFTLPIAA